MTNKITIKETASEIETNNSSKSGESCKCIKQFQCKVSENLWRKCQTLETSKVSLCLTTINIKYSLKRVKAKAKNPHDKSQEWRLSWETISQKRRGVLKIVTRKKLQRQRKKWKRNCLSRNKWKYRLTWKVVSEASKAWGSLCGVVRFSTVSML